MVYRPAPIERPTLDQTLHPLNEVVTACWVPETQTAPLAYHEMDTGYKTITTTTCTCSTPTFLVDSNLPSFEISE